MIFIHTTALYRFRTSEPETLSVGTGVVKVEHDLKTS